MREGFSTPEPFSKKRARQEIEGGIAEYLATPISKEGIHAELTDIFEVEESEQPLNREEVEKEIERFVDKNLETVLPILLSSEQNHAELIQHLGLTNEEIGLLGVNYYIRQKDGKPAIFQTDERYPEGKQVAENNITSGDLLALAYAKESIRVDSSREAGRFSGDVSHRYYLKSKNRYLCANDFGMRAWNEEENKMDEGDITNATPFIKTAKAQIDRIAENIDSYTAELRQRIQTEVETEIPPVNRAEYALIYEDGLHGVPQEAPQHEPVRLKSQQEYWAAYHERADRIEKKVLERMTQEVLKQFSENSKDKTLVLEAIPTRKVQDHLHFYFDKIAKKYGFVSGNPEKDYQLFEQNIPKLNQLFREPTEQERAGTSLDFVYSDFYRKPVMATGHFDRASIIAEARYGVKETLARKAADSNPQVKEVFHQSRCFRAEMSPYSYPDYEVYDFIRTVGVECAQQVFEADDRNRSEQMAGLRTLKAMKYDISKFEPDQLKKQLHQAYTLERTGLWQYLKERNKVQTEQASVKLGKKAQDKHWLELLGIRNARNQFREGKKMHWLAKQVWINKPNRAQEDRFYRDDSNVNWDKYDLTKADVTEEKLNEYLAKNKNLIVALLGQEIQVHNGEQKDQGKSATLGLIIQALERGNDIRGVALAHDKQRYLEGVISGNVENDLEFAVADWPADWHKAVSPEEINLYYEYASDYVLLDPNALTKYAAWRASVEGGSWAQVFKEIPTRKDDLDFRICLGSQTEEVRGWYREAAEHVGGSVMQNYLLRFNATRGTDGSIANWHDVLLWSPNIRRLETEDAKSILLSIETMDNNQELVNLLPRYSKERDPLQSNGPLQSLRELKKRVLAIESNIDLSKFPPELLEITSAPGFNLGALESMRARANFQDLLEGKLDKDQPFHPHTRTFAGRALTEALREGLGSQKQKIKGTAQDPKGLFHALNQLVKGREVGEKKMTALDLLDSVPVDTEEEVIRLLREQRVNIGPIVEAQIHAKSDPEGWVCGNYTDCCMPFGDSKNNDYMFNRSTQYFTIKYNGRIVAQSVVVDSRDRENNDDVVVLDNIEVANNYKNLSPLFANVYQTFWAEYTSKPVKVGTGYSDLIPPGGKLEPNHYQAKTHLSYSDATGSRIYDLPKLRGVESIDKVITFANLSDRDAELIAKMEAEAYPEGMTQGKAHIADVLQKQRALEVPGAASSFVVRQGQEAAGYLLVLPEESEVNSGEKVAHVYDMAVLPKFRGSPIARKMMERVLDVASAYGVPIEAEARASTSYALLMNERIRKWFETKGFFLTKNEKLPEYLGGEDFYFVRFENRQNAAVTA